MKKLLMLAAIAVLSGLIIFNCSKDSTEPEDNNYTFLGEANVGPDGGLLYIPGKLGLVIAPGALNSTVKFSISQNNSPDPVGGSKIFVSPVFLIEPSGTQFNGTAAISIHYDEASLHGVPEDQISIFTNEGSGWTDIGADGTTDDDFVFRSISHISEFAAVVDTAEADTTQPAEGIYAKLIVARAITNYGGDLFRMDSYVASFDSAYAPCEPIQPLQAAGVTCNDTALDWNSSTGIYIYQDIYNLEFIELGGNYEFVIAGNSKVPSLTEAITFPETEPYITTPQLYDTVSATGFDVSWANSGTGTIDLAIASAQGDTVVYITTANDGSYTFSSSDLEGVSSGAYGLVLNYYNLENIDASGYDSRSLIAARVLSAATIYIE